MTGQLRILYLFISLFLATDSLFSQTTTFTATVDATEVTLQDYFTITFKVENGDGLEFKPPSFTGFNILGGPNRSMSTTIINGSFSKSSAYSYTLEPTTRGTFTIGPASVRVEGRTYTSNPVTIKVTDAPKSSGNIDASQKVFVRLETSVKTAYPGQQIALDYRLYRRTDITSTVINKEPVIDGAYVKESKNFNAGDKRIQAGGQAYLARSLRRQILYPNQTSNVTISPAVFTLGIPDDNDDPFSTLFGASRPLQVKTNSLEIEVKPLPAPIPAAFSGAVGRFEYSCTPDKTQLTTDDAVTLTFTISGDGDLKPIKIPSFPLDSSYEAYDPQLQDEQEADVSGTFKNIKKYTIALLPRHTGELVITLPEFVYFDPSGKTYKTIRPEPIKLIVSKGNKPPTAESPPPTPADTQIPSFFEKNKWLILSGGMMCILVIGWLIARGKKKTPVAEEKSIDIQIDRVEPISTTTAAVAPFMPAGKDIHFRLTTTEAKLRAGDMKGFYADLNSLFGQYISEKLEIPFSEFSRQRVQIAMSVKDTQPLIAREIDQVLARLEFANYAPQHESEAAEQLLEKVKSLIGQLG
ncbi:MAG TPA: BatD family protein [Saprospiraceae bacterium]|nr:BatD family protein [Saprospiraceae bacterium]